MSRSQNSILIVAPHRQTQQSSAVQTILPALERSLLKQGFGVRIDRQGADTGIDADVQVYLAFGPDDLPQYPVTVIGKRPPRRIAACLNWRYHCPPEAKQLSDSFAAVVEGELPQSRFDVLLKALTSRIVALQYSETRLPRLGQGWDGFWAFSEEDTALLSAAGIAAETIALHDADVELPPKEKRAGIVYVGPVLESYGFFTILAAAHSYSVPLSVIFPGPFIDPELTRVVKGLYVGHPAVEFITFEDSVRIKQALSSARLVVAPGRDACTRLFMNRVRDIPTLVLGADGDIDSFDIANVSSVQKIIRLEAELSQNAIASIASHRRSISREIDQLMPIQSICIDPISGVEDSLSGAAPQLVTIDEIAFITEPSLSSEQQTYSESIRTQIAQMVYQFRSQGGSEYERFRLSVFETLKRLVTTKQLMSARAVANGYSSVAHDDTELLLLISRLFLDAQDAITARVLVESTLTRQPTNPAALKALAAIELKLGRPDGAERYFRLAIRSDQRDSDAFTGLGYAALQRGDVSSAFESLQHALQLQPQHHDALHGVSLIRQLVASAQSPR